MNSQNLEKSLSIFEILDFVIYRKFYLAFIILVFAVASIVYSSSIDTTYKSEVILYPSDNTGSNPNIQGLPSFIGLNFDESSSSVKNMAILQSKDFLIKFIKDNDLPKIIFAEQWDEKRDSWLHEKPSVIEAYNKFIKNFFVVEENKTNGLVTLAIISRNPETSSYLANELVSSLNEFIRLKDLEEIKKNLDFLNSKLKEEANIYSKNYISQLLQTETTRLMKANSSQDYAFTVIDPAMTPSKKYAPSRLKILVSSIFLSLVICFIILAGEAIIREYLKHIKEKNNE